MDSILSLEFDRDSFFDSDSWKCCWDLLPSCRCGKLLAFYLECIGKHGLACDDLCPRECGKGDDGVSSV